MIRYGGVFARPNRRQPFSAALALIIAANLFGLAAPLRAQTVAVNVDATSVLGAVPNEALALHTSVYANQFTNSSLDDRLIESGVQMLRYSGGNYSQIFHFSVPPVAPYYQTCCSTLPDVTKPHPLTPDKGADPASLSPWPYGYYASGSHFGNFINLLDASGSDAMITVNYGSSLGNFDAASGKWLSKKGGQPNEAAAWVAYANSSPTIYGTPADVDLGVDAEGIDWKTAGYWARLRASTPAEFQSWAQADGVYDPVNSFLAVNHDAPVGIKYWEIGNEINGNGYYASYWNWEQDLHGAYDGNRTNDPALSPTAYGNNFIQFANAMKAVDPTIKLGGVLVGPGGVGDTGSTNTNWDRNVLRTAGNQMDFGILHWYVDDDPTATSGNCTIGNAACEANFLNATAAQLPAIYQELRNRVDLHTDHDPNAFPIHMTEFGYFDSVGNSNVATGLFAADVYATALEEGADSVHFLEMSAATFLSDNSSLTRGPAFRALEMLDKFFDSGDELIDTSSGSANLKVHAVRQSDGTVAVMLINLLSGAGNDTDVTIDILGSPLGNSGTQWAYGGTGGSAPVQSSVNGLGNSFTYNVAPRTLIVLLIPPAGLPGDYNDDGTVGAADYAVWRDTLNQTGSGLAADGNGDNRIDSDDYDIWRAHFGQSAGSGAGAHANAAIPEPGTLVLLIVGMLSIGSCRRAAV